MHGQQLWPIDHAGISLALSKVLHPSPLRQTETYPYFLPSPGKEEANQGPGPRRCAVATRPVRLPAWLLPSCLPCTREGSQSWGNVQAGPGTLQGHLWAAVLTETGPSWEGDQRHWPQSQSAPRGAGPFSVYHGGILTPPIPRGSLGGTGLPRRGVGRGDSDHRDVGLRGRH